MNESAVKDTVIQEDKADSLRLEVAFLKDTVEALSFKLKASEDQSKSLENKLNTLMLLVESIKANIDSKHEKADSLGINADTQNINTDTGRIKVDLACISVNTNSINADTPSINADTGRNNADTERNNADTGKINLDTGKDNTDTETVKKLKILHKDEFLRKTISLKGENIYSSQQIKKKWKKAVTETLKKTQDISTEEITRLMDYWTRKPKHGYDAKRTIGKSLEIIDSYLNSNEKTIDQELKRNLIQLKVILSIKKEVLTRLDRKDIVRTQSGRLLRILFYLEERSPVDMQMLMTDFKVPRITISRDLKILRELRWARTISWGPAAMYSLTDEGRNYLLALTDEQGL